MSDNPSFRSALNGFNRTDVVRYIEYITARHNTQINQLNADIARLREELDQARNTPVQDPQLPELLAQAEAQRDEYRAQAETRAEENQALTARIADLEAQAAQSPVLADTEAKLRAAEEARDQALAQVAALRSSTDRELEAYRRAERTERKARERAEQIYHQANGALADASAQVDDAATQLSELTSRTIAQLEQLRSTVTGSKEALRSAADTLYAIRPTGEDE